MAKENLAGLVPESVWKQFARRTKADQERLFRLLNVDGVRVEQIESADAIIVLGTVPSAFPVKFQARVTKTVELWRRGLAPRIVCSGGIDDEFPTEEPQALLLKTAITNSGVSERVIDVETDSTSTKENIINSGEILQRIGVRSVIIVGSQSQGRRMVQYGRRYLDGIAVQVVAADNDLTTNPEKLWEEVAKLLTYRHKGDL